MKDLQAQFLIAQGRVQMVGFRYFTMETARILGICGWVRNREDGGVEAFIEGPQDALEMMIERIKEGPRGALVAELKREIMPVKGCKDFRIRY